MQQEKTTFVKTDGAELFCKEIGTGDPLIVLHGGAGYLTHDYLLSPLQCLANSNRVIFYDQRGLGKSTGEITSEQITLEKYITDVEVVRKSLGIEKVSLLGHSWGSFLALHYAITYPDNVEKLILTSSMPAVSDDLGFFFAELTKRLEPHQEKLQAIEASEPFRSGDPQVVEDHLRMVFRVYMCVPDSASKLTLWRPKQAVLNGCTVWDIFKEQIFMKPYDMTERLKELHCPVLIVHGDVDPIPFATAEYLQAIIPSSRLVKIPQSGHFPFIEQPEHFYKAVDEFLANIPI